MKSRSIHGWALAAWFCAALAHAQALDTFAFSAPIALPGTATDSAYYRIPLPRAFYAGSRANFADLRVFNGAGEAVTQALLATLPTTDVAQLPQSLQLFPVRVNAAASTAGDLTLTLARTAQRTELRVTTQGGANAAGSELTAYLLDAGSADARFAALRICGTPAPLNTRVRVDASDNLVAWRTVAADAPLIAVDFGGRRLARLAIDFAPTRARYWRIAWHGGTAPAFDCVEGLPPQRQVEALRERDSVEGHAVPDQPGDIDYDLGASLPVDRVSFAFADTNTVAPLSIFVRNDAKEAWRPIAQGVFYRVEQGGATLENAPVTVTAGHARYWRVHADPSTGGVGKRLPQLVVGWPAEQVVFVARGGGPYTLAWGDATAAPASLGIAALFPGAADVRAAAEAVPVATVGASVANEPTRAAGMTAAELRRVGLWAVLVVAALVLGAMGIGLARQMNTPKS